MNTQETKMTTPIEPEITLKTEEVPCTIAEDNSQKDNATKEHDSPKDFTKKAVSKELGSKFATQNDGNVINQYIINIDRMEGDITSVQKEESVSKIAANHRRYKLNERQDCSDFVMEYKISLHLAYAIAISMFEYVPVSDLQRLSGSLLQRFDKLPKEYDENGKEVTAKISPFIPLDTILDTIGAQTCKVSFTSRFENVTERCLSFGELRDKVRENLWELFPTMRSEIVSWLIEINFGHSYSNTFSINYLVKAMSNIVKMDFGDAMNRLFLHLESQEKNKYLAIKLMLLLVKDDDIKKNVYEILRRWAASPKWLWEISLVVYTLADEELPFTDELEKTLTQKFLSSFDAGWGDWSIYFISGQMMKSLRLRNLVSHILHKLATNGSCSKNENIVAVIYLLTISNAYQFVNKENVALSLVAVDNKKQLEDIEVLLHKVFSDFALRHGLFEILEAYLEEINGYGTTERLLNQLKGYFYIIAKKSERFNGDVQRFLSRLQVKQNKTASEILAFLQEKLPFNKELIKL